MLSLVASGMNVQPPSYDQAPAAFVAWFAESSQRFRIGHFIAGIAFLLFYFPFFAGFCERLREAEGTPAIWSRVAWAGAIVWNRSLCRFSLKDSEVAALEFVLFPGCAAEC